MTTAYTPILKLALPVTGELSGTWGTVVNDNITSMVEQAVAGLATISTWTGNTSHTLTTADGTSSESRCAMLVLATGSGGSALTGPGDVTCPATSKLYVVKNGTSFAVTVKAENVPPASPDPGIAIPAGETAFLFCDGTNVNQCVTSFVNATLSGNLTVNGNTTLGDAATDTITATGQFNTDLLPSTDNARDLGSTAKSWRTLYCETSVIAANITISGNTISSTDTNGNITLAPNGTGDVQLDADTIRVGDSGANVTITSNGAGDLILNTNSGTNSGSITIEDGANGNITVATNGTGDVYLDADTVRIGDSNANATLTTNGTGDLILNTNSGTNSGAITIEDGANGNIIVAPNGTGDVQLDADTIRVGDTGANVTITSNGAGDLILNTNSGTNSGSITIEDGANGAINLTPNGTGAVVVPLLRLSGSTSGYVGLKGAAIAGSATYTLPAADGTNGQVLSTNGTGTLSWVAAAASGVTSFSAGTTGLTPNTTTTGAVTLAGTLAIANGGTGQTTASAAFNALAPSQTGNNGKYLTTDGTNTSWATVSGGGSPGGSDTQVQFNDSGSFGGDADFTWNKTTNTLTIAGIRFGRGGGAIATNLAIGPNTITGAATGQRNIAIGDSALKDITSGQDNLAIGFETLFSATTATSANIAIGTYAARVTTGNLNVAIGPYALQSNGAGTNNTIVGYSAVDTGTTISNTTAVGHKALQKATGNTNTAVGSNAGALLTTGTNNLILGYNAEASAVGVDNEITLGNSSIATLRCQVTTITALSDARDKKDVQDIPLGVSFIQRLHPVSFVWNTRDGGKVDVPEFGFIAQELQQAQADHGVTLPGLVHDINPERLEAAPGTLIPVLVKAVQELQAQIDDLKRQLAARG